MIYILSLNPSIDYHMDIDEIILGATNRSQSERMEIGGKGINVASVLNELERESTLIGFIGGDTGNFINRALDKLPFIQNKMIQTRHNTRINVKLKGKLETEINGTGKAVSETEIKQLESFTENIQASDTIIITGRIAEGMPKDWYIKLAKIVRKKDANLIVDIATKDLKEICKYKPLLIKPNISELEKIFELTIKTDEEIVEYAKKLIDQGAENCIVSLGSKGSMLINKEHIYHANVPKGNLVNSVGAGDSMVAGFTDAYLKHKDIKKAYRMAAASGSATAYTTHLAKKDDIDKLIKEIEIGA